MSDIRVFVGKIPPVVQKEHLQKHFSQFGNVTDVFLPASNQGKTSRIAFVTYDDEKGLYAALGAESHVIEDHSLRVTKAAPKGQPGFRRDGPTENSRLFVGNLNPSTTDTDLKDHFSQFGNITSCIVHAGKSDKGYAFVSFSAAQGMFNALGAAPPVINGSQAKVVEAQPKPPPGHYGRSSGPAIDYGRNPYPPQGYGYGGGYGGGGGGGYSYPPPSRPHFRSAQPAHPAAPAPRRERDQREKPRIFLTPPPDTDESALKQYFSKFGTVTDVFLPRGRANIAFVTMGSTSELYSALAGGPHVLDGFDMKAVEAKPKGVSTSSNPRRVPRIFIGRIPQNVTDSDLKSHFEQYGTVTDIYRPKSNKNPDFQIAFCIFEGESALFACLASGSPQKVNGASISVTRAQPRPNPGQRPPGPPAMMPQALPPQPMPSAYSAGYNQHQNMPENSASMSAYSAASYNPYMQQQQVYSAEYAPRVRQQRYMPY